MLLFFHISYLHPRLLSYRHPTLLSYRNPTLLLLPLPTFILWFRTNGSVRCVSHVQPLHPKRVDYHVHYDILLIYLRERIQKISVSCFAKRHVGGFWRVFLWTSVRSYPKCVLSFDTVIYFGPLFEKFGRCTCSFKRMNEPNRWK